jgi:hypothetical protein
MPFWIASAIALVLAALATPSLQRVHGMDLLDPSMLALIAAAFAIAGLMLRSRSRNHMVD